MVIWLRNPQHEGAAAGPGIGVDGDVLRGEQLATLVDIDAALHEMRAQGEAELVAARVQAQALLDAVKAQAAELEARATQRYENAAREGYEAGLSEALTDWHERVMRTSGADGRTPQRRQRDRLAELVALAVEQMVAASDPADRFRRAAGTLEQIVGDGSPLEVRVHPSDLRAATEAFGEAVRGWRDTGCAVRLRVQADVALEPGTCLCESDLGAVDASLSLQLAATRAALVRAVDSIADETLEDDPQDREAAQDEACLDAGGRHDAGTPVAGLDETGGGNEAAGVGYVARFDAQARFAQRDAAQDAFAYVPEAARAAYTEETLHGA